MGLLLILILIFKYEVGYFSKLSWFYNYTTITTIRTIYTYIYIYNNKNYVDYYDG